MLLPSAWYAGTLKEDHWLTLLRARAIENTCYVVGVNTIGASFCGRSAAFDPFGVQIADAGEQEQVWSLNSRPNASAMFVPNSPSSITLV